MRLRVRFPIRAVQNPPQNFEPEKAIERFLGLASGPLPAVLILAAYPGDEIVGAGGQLNRFAPFSGGIPERLLVVHPSSEPSDYWLTAFLAGGLNAGCRVTLGLPDGKPLPCLAEFVRLLLAQLWEFRPDIILTHPYEGGCPAYDACAFAAQEACSLMMEEIGAPPIRLEMPDCRAGEAPLFSSAPPGCVERLVPLGAADRIRKALMLSCLPAYASLAADRWNGERLRTAPRYDFSQTSGSGRNRPEWMEAVRQAEKDLRSR